VVEFVALQLQKLPAATQNVLKLAACIGNQFDLATLAIVSEQLEIDAADSLWMALQEGLILPTSEVYKFYLGQEDRALISQNSEIVVYKFLHDRVQQGAYFLIPEEKRAIAHYQIGQLLLQQILPAAREDRIFAIVNQLNYGLALIADQTERDHLAALNLSACRKARASTAYQAAREYAEIGLNLLGSVAWQRQYEMTLKFHELAAEVAALSGKFEQMNQLVADAIAHANTPLELTGIYTVKIQGLMSQNEFLEAILIGQLFLKELGVEFPEFPSLEDIQNSIQEISTLTQNRPIEELFYLPPMVDPEKLAIMQVLASILPAFRLVGSLLSVLAIALLVKLSLQYGNSPISAFIYGVYGALLVDLLQDVTTATQFSQLAYHLASEVDAKSIRPATFVVIGLSVHHYKFHAREVLPIFQAGYQAGLETGNLEYVGYNAHGFCLTSYCCGEPLAQLASQLSAYRQQLLELNQLAAANYCEIYAEITLFLSGSLSPREVSFEQLENEEKLVSQSLAVNDLLRVFIFYLCRAIVRFLMGNIALAKADILQSRKYIAGGVGRIVEALYFYDSLIALAIEPESQTELETQAQRIAANQARLQRWAEYAPMNYLHQWQLVAAEQARVSQQKWQAAELYDLAIAGAKENGYIQEEALANELAAKFYLEWGKEKVAAGYLQEAYYCYSRWGAKAKTNDLEQRYPQLLQPILQQQKFSFNHLETIASITRSINKKSISSSSATSSSVCDELDFGSILKAAQVISSR